MNIISKEVARTAGRKRYFTGRMCKNGHTAERYVFNGKCVECRAASKVRARNTGRTTEVRNQKRAKPCTCCTVGQRTAVYSEARQQRKVVDHIIPVSKDGPHCVHNLQIISKLENNQKYNKYDPMVEGMRYLQNQGLA